MNKAQAGFLVFRWSGVLALVALVWQLRWYTPSLLAAHCVLTLAAFYMVMGLKAARDGKGLTPEQQAFVRWFGTGAVLMDLAFNWVWTPVVFGTPAQAWMFTGTLEHFKYRGTGLRQRLAALICEQWLDTADGGCHCHPPN